MPTHIMNICVTEILSLSTEILHHVKQLLKYGHLDSHESIVGKMHMMSLVPRFIEIPPVSEEISHYA